MAPGADFPECDPAEAAAPRKRPFRIWGLLGMACLLAMMAFLGWSAWRHPSIESLATRASIERLAQDEQARIRNAIGSEAFDRLPLPERRRMLHAIVASPGQHHDAYLMLAEIGDASSVPLLIHSLKSFEPVQGGGMVCTQAHCLGALRAITNQDAGNEYQEWALWWGRHRDEPVETWVHDGFAQAGLPVSRPPDEAYAAALIRTTEQGKGHLQENAWRVLTDLPSDRVEACAARSLRSPSAEERRGAIRVLAKLRGGAALSTLRSMCSDGDRATAQAALEETNRLLREEWSRAPDRPVLRKVDVDGELVATDSEPGRLMLCRQRKGLSGWVRSVGEYDLTSRAYRWSVPAPDRVHEPPVRSGDRVFFVASDGSVSGVDTSRGVVVWERRVQSDDGGSCARACEVLGGYLLAEGPGFVSALKRDTGEPAWTRSIARMDRGVCIQGETAFTCEASGQIVALSADGELLARGSIAGKPRLLAAGNQGVCLISDDGPVRLTAYDASTLAVAWTREVCPEATFDTGRPILLDRTVLVVFDNRNTTHALDGATGAWLWAQCGRPRFLVPCPGERIVLQLGGLGEPEVWDARTGLIVATYAVTKERGDAGRGFRVVRRNDGHWVLDPPDDR